METLNPLKEPVPEDRVARVQALARDLAFGAVNGLWGTETTCVTHSKEETQWLDTATGNKLRELKVKWTNAAPAPSLLVSFGYMQFLRRDNNSGYYVLTQASFNLLTQAHGASIFISYRRCESSAFALLVLARIKTALGAEPFLDMRISPGDEWHAQLEFEVKSREHFVCLLSPTSLESHFVRREIQWAEEAQRQVIPIWHNHFNDGILGDFQKRYPELGRFAERQAIQVEQENTAAYNNALVQLVNRFGVTPG